MLLSVYLAWTSITRGYFTCAGNLGTSSLAIIICCRASSGLDKPIHWNTEQCQIHLQTVLYCIYVWTIVVYVWMAPGKISCKLTGSPSLNKVFELNWIETLQPIVFSPENTTFNWIVGFIWVKISVDFRLCV